MSSLPTLSINSHQHAESITENLNESAAFMCAEQSISRPPPPLLTPNIASFHNLWKWQRVGGEKEKKCRQMCCVLSSSAHDSQ